MALSAKAVRSWYLVHKWTSLVCTVFLLILCVTGLPLIFHDEIDGLSHGAEPSDIPSGKSHAHLETIVAEAKKERPDWVVMFLTWDQEAPMVSAVVGPSMQATESDVLIVPFDSRSGERLSRPPPNEGVMYFLLDLHASLLMGLPGTLFLGAMGLVFVVSVVSGIVVYAPFMRRLPFAKVRKDRTPRIKWLDTHNMVGIVTLAWVSVVGVTGIVLTMVTPITAIWQQDKLASIAAAYEGTDSPIEPVSADVVRASVLERVPDADISFISWPGSPFATPHHYTVALRGDTPFTKHLIRIAMVDAQTGAVTGIEDTPWYISAINLSVPLHFGDYGGLPLKIIWALLDVAAIVILISGLYLWLEGRHRSLAVNLKESEVCSDPEVAK